VKDTDIIAAIAPDAVSLMDKAIAEIKRLRQENATLTAERDEARRSVCEQEAQDCFLMPDKLGKGTIVNTPQMEASRRGWDCYKEDNPCQ
jgi:hypothetical protein